MSKKNWVTFWHTINFFIFIMFPILWFFSNLIYGYLISNNSYYEYNDLPKNCSNWRIIKTVCYKDIDWLIISNKDKIILKFISYNWLYLALFTFLCTMSSFFYYWHKK